MIKKSWMDKKKSTIVNNNFNNFTASYSSVGYKDSIKYKKSVFTGYLNRLNRVIDWDKCKEPYSGLILAEVRFKYPYLQCADYEVIALAVLQLLMKYAYHTKYENGKFTIGYTMIIPKGEGKDGKGEGEISYILGNAINIYDSRGNAVPDYNTILKFIKEKAEIYDNALLKGIFLRVYLGGSKLETRLPPSSDEIHSKIWDIIKDSIGNPIKKDTIGEPQEVKAIGKSRYPNHIPVLKPRSESKGRRSFIVADTETVLVNDVHVPYAAGFLVVKPGDDVGAKPDHSIETYFSEDYSYVIHSFEERSNRMLFDFLDRLAVIAAETKIRTIYFHNFSRFDGLIIMKYYACHGDKYTFKPLVRNLRIYELSVYRNKKRVFRFRDSLTLLPSSLKKLAKALCPQLGPKGDIPHDDVQVSNLQILSKQLVEYMKQDIRLLGGIMLKAQDIYWTQYKVDIESIMTLSSLALTIFRMNYYDPNSWPIHIPSNNEDTFIRRGFYGGHADAYKPYGENLYYYDVNSLYPYIMKTFHMPGGVPVWHGNLENQDLSNMYGFIEAYVVCPRTITRPFLPYKDKNNTLLFPTGKFVGVYYSEELIYARDLGYKILPLRGYLFEKKTSPFEGFVSSLFEKRQEAKKTGNEAMSYVYKTLMNSLYGRFGINPESTITEICKRERYEYLTQRENLIMGDQLSELYYIVNYRGHIGNAADSSWRPTQLSAVQLSAAITACARIHMYKYISRPDCYYTDTDSAILGSPLPEDEISSIELGKLKLEYHVEKATFLAPKSYTLKTKDTTSENQNIDIVKHKGIAKSLVDAKWFESQYFNPSQTKLVTAESNFRINWPTLNITKKNVNVTLGIKIDTKRDPVYNKKDVWVDTKPKDVIDFGGQESSIIRFELKMIQELLDMKDKEHCQTIEEHYQTIASLKSEIAKLREEKQSLSESAAKLPEEPVAKLPEKPVMSPLTEESPTGLDQPTLYKHPTEAKKPKKGKKKGKKKKGNDTS